MTQDPSDTLPPPSTGWIPVALSDSFRSGNNIRSLVDGRDVAVWSSFSGKVSAWANRCPHRGMRLSHGFVRGEMLACIYHGWHFAQDANCKYIPAHPELVPGEMICVPTYHCLVQDGLIWVSCAEAAPPSPQPVPGHGVRSLLVNAPLGDVADSLDIADATQGRHVTSLDAEEVLIGLQFWNASQTYVHLLTPEVVDAGTRKRLSRKLEACRSKAEAASASAGVPQSAGAAA